MPFIYHIASLSRSHNFWPLFGAIRFWQRSKRVQNGKFMTTNSQTLVCGESARWRRRTVIALQKFSIKFIYSIYSFIRLLFISSNKNNAKTTATYICVRLRVPMTVKSFFPIFVQYFSLSIFRPVFFFCCFTAH